ncbi:nitric oxide-associated protein 1-like [Daphnia carinata]|uniref:nitric oxide-associated protein 1-like n=1 Tax=Daphnia carinata TaxID=120202 RepID=UPI00257A64C2|nr:nitric oxide-associated protein 1-like [Daphnia carinata]
MISLCCRNRKLLVNVQSIYLSRKSLSSENRALEESTGVDTDSKGNNQHGFYIDARYKVSSVNNAAKVKITNKEIENKIIYNSFVDSFVDRSPFMDRVRKYKKINSQERIQKQNELLTKEVESIVASVVTGNAPHMNSEEQKNEELSQEESDSVSFPYLRHTPTNQKLQNYKEKKIAKLYELHLKDELSYGSPDPSIPMSKIPCGGCGAMLHCQSPSIPGYLPSEIFTICQTHDLRGKICQRCRFLREHDVALNVNISPEDYPKVISVIRDQIAMVVLVVDLVDFPCSIWPGLLDIIGTKRPVCVVGNKVDLIPQDSRGYLDHMKKCLVNEIEKSGIRRANIKHVSLISATTGFGVEQLITKIQNSWGTRGDVYLLGCTNVGKSSLFNALISSDFCKTQASDLLERATVSAWPGTTLNLLKFPMLRPTAIRLHERTLRLISENKMRRAEEKLRKEKLKETRNRAFATLIGHIGRTFTVKAKEEMESTDPFSMRADKIPSEEDQKNFNPNHKDFAASKWCYDTPGTISPSQILTLLTLEELMLTLPKKLIKPRTVLLKPGMTYFLAGLGRIDYLDGPHSLLLTTLSSSYLPLTLVSCEDADKVYSELLGSRLLAIPCGSEQRLKQWPGLVSKDVTFKGAGWKECAVDIVLSSAGYVAVTGEEDTDYNLKVYTPYARGIHIRSPPLLRHAVRLRGNRLSSSQAFCNNRLILT